MGTEERRQSEVAKKICVEGEKGLYKWKVKGIFFFIKVRPSYDD